MSDISHMSTEDIKKLMKIIELHNDKLRGNSGSTWLKCSIELTRRNEYAA